MALFACVLRDSMKVSCMVMAAREEEEAPPTDALTRVAQPRCLRSKKQVCSPIRLTETQQVILAVTLRAGLEPPPLPAPQQEPGCGLRVWPSCDRKTHHLAQQSAPEGSSCHSHLFPSWERPSEQPLLFVEWTKVL